MIFLQALWHSVKIVTTAGYWLLTLLFVWAGLAQLTSRWGWACFACVLAIFAARGLIARRITGPDVANVLACAAYGLFLAVAGMLTRYDMG